MNKIKFEFLYIRIVVKSVHDIMKLHNLTCLNAVRYMYSTNEYTFEDYGVWKKGNIFKFIRDGLRRGYNKIDWG